MKYNSSGPCQSQKRGTCEPTEHGIIEFLWALLDDIDTAGDMAKGDDKLFRGIVERTQKRRWETGIICDGYTIDIDAGLKTGTAQRESLDAEKLRRWIIGRWDAEVKRRPIQNVNRRTLDGAWRQIYRHIASDELPRPKHPQTP